MTHKTIRKELKIQQSIEGYTPETALLLHILPMVKYASEWKTLTTIKHHRYGSLSYETHRFYYPSELLLKLQNFFEQ